MEEARFTPGLFYSAFTTKAIAKNPEAVADPIS